jgi:hypothetical protein
MPKNIDLSSPLCIRILYRKILHCSNETVLLVSCTVDLPQRQTVNASVKYRLKKRETANLFD